MSGEQFALPEAVGQLRAVRRLDGGGRLNGPSAADRLNLTGIITPGERTPGLTSNRVLYRDGVPALAREAGQILLIGTKPSLRPSWCTPSSASRAPRRSGPSWG